jgi:glycosyltransferase involved in cell wall biosynthesis
MKSIAIVMAYYNRFELLCNTLESIQNNPTKPNEIIIVDDASEIPLNTQIILNEYNLNIKIITITKEQKFWINSCMAYNIGFNHVESNITIIQNPECYHANDIIGHVQENLNDSNDYFIYGCYSLPRNELPCKNYVTKNKGVSFEGDDGWYNHSLYRRVGYHFTSAIYTEVLREIGGFDERFATGYAYEDNMLVYKINKKCQFSFIDQYYSLHQFHYYNNFTPEQAIERHKRIEQNRNLFQELTRSPCQK